MDGNYVKKLTRLIAYLSAHPLLIPRYFRDSIRRNSPLDLGLPWISYSAIEFLEGFLKKDHHVVEFGGGGSTLFFSKHAGSVLCIESSDEWAKKIGERLTDNKISNVVIDVLPYDPLNLDEYRISTTLRRIDSAFFDVILVDGYEESVELRPTCFWHAEMRIKKGGIIIVDDSWRYPVLRERNKAKKRITYRSIGPCRPGVTTTDIFFY
jgi:predicted O-methyltransferase YrrM